MTSNTPAELWRIPVSVRRLAGSPLHVTVRLPRPVDVAMPVFDPVGVRTLQQFCSARSFDEAVLQAIEESALVLGIVRLTSSGLLLSLMTMQLINQEEPGADAVDLGMSVAVFARDTSKLFELSLLALDHSIGGEARIELQRRSETPDRSEALTSREDDDGASARS